MATIVPINKPASPYVTLEQLTALAPPEDDYTIEQVGTFRVRGLRNGEVQSILRAARRPDGTFDEEIDKDHTVAMGLLAPSLGDDRTAALVIVGGMPTNVRALLCGKIRDLTWGWMLPQIQEAVADAREQAGAEPVPDAVPPADA